MDVDAVRERVVVAGWIAAVLIGIGAFSMYAAVDEASRSLSGQLPDWVFVGWVLIGAGGMLGTAAAVGWVVTARRPGTAADGSRGSGHVGSEAATE